jgi:hypothetical protein
MSTTDKTQRFLIINSQADLDALGSIRWVWPYKTRRTSDQLRQTYPSGIIGRAAAAIVVFSDASLTDRRCNGEYAIWESLEVSNAAASIQNILLLATAKGIASCWLSFNQRMSNSRLMSYNSIRKAFPDYCIPPFLKPQGIVILGYPKRVDVSGFPHGEDYHGTTHQAVRRRELDYYLLKPSPIDSAASFSFSPMSSLKRLILLSIVRLSSKITSYSSSKLERLELDIIAKTGREEH